MGSQRPKHPAKPSGDSVSSTGPVRIQKLLARAGVGSRREVEGWMEAGRLTVNGQAAAPGQKATVEDRFELDGKRLEVSGAAEVLSPGADLQQARGRSDHPEGSRGPSHYRYSTALPRLKEHRWISIGRLGHQHDRPGAVYHRR